MDDKNTSIATSKSQDELNIEITPVQDKMNIYDERIKKIMQMMLEENLNVDDKNFREEIVNFELFLDQESVNRINNTHKLNFHLANILKDLNYPFPEN